MSTDNSTAESCFYRGSSKSRQLHALVLVLRTLEMTCGMTIHVIHMSGKQMIAQGTDGCSRGSLMEGLMISTDMLTFVDLVLNAVERHPPILDWVRTWTDRPDLVALISEGWYKEGHGIMGGVLDKHKVWIPTHGKKGGLFLWTPPPAVGDAAIEELLKARHKRTDMFHVVMIPCLMTPQWRRLFNKACDFTFVVSPGTSFWPSDMFEPLWVGIILPFSQHRPWCFKQAPLLVEMGRDLREVLAAGETNGRDILQKILKLLGLVAPMLERMACGMLHVPGRAPSIPNVVNQGQARKPMAQGRGKTSKVGSRSQWRAYVHSFSVQTVLDAKSGRKKSMGSQGQSLYGVHKTGKP
jgi:hypothetical protein